MDEDLEARIRRRAHEMWEQDGKPLDKGTSYWLAAEREIVEIAERAAGAAPKAAGGVNADDAKGTSIASAFAPGLSPSDPRHA